MAYTLSQAMRKRRGKKMNSSITYTKDEPYALCFYLYNIFSDVSNQTIMKDNDEAIKLFLDNVDKLDKQERLNNVLSKEIHNLEKSKKLKLITRPIAEEMVFEDYDIPYKYEQDKKVERIIRRFDNGEKLVVNLHRVMVATEEPIFSSIINTTIFSDDPDFTLTDRLDISKKIQKLTLYTKLLLQKEITCRKHHLNQNHPTLYLYKLFYFFRCNKETKFLSINVS